MSACDDGRIRVEHGDCLDVLAAMPDSSVDAAVTDPPYELAFMGRRWDASGVAFDPETWRCVLRVLKPGGHLLAFGGTRTWHRLACAIEDAGFEIRDSIHWVYGSGFPKSLDVSKAIDRAAGVEREIIGSKSAGIRAPGQGPRYTVGGPRAVEVDVTAPATDDARRWEGWGTALKPSHEPIVVARKPLAGTVAGNVLAHGTGALNVDGCRVATDEYRGRPPRTPNRLYGGGNGTNLTASESDPAGRWPPNLLLTHDEDCGQRCVDGCPVAELDRQSGERPAGSAKTGLEPKAAAFSGDLYGAAAANGAAFDGYGDTGGASRFFPVFRYEPKADSGERPRVGDTAHATVKPLDLMRWLVRLVTPPGGTVLDPFAGSGTTLEAARLEGFRAVGVEKEADYLPLIRARLTRRLDPVQHLRDRGATAGTLFDEETA